MNELLARFSEHQVAGFFLVLGRIGPLFAFAPLLSSKLVPVRVRMIVALALAMAMTPIALRGASVPLGVGELAGLMGKEMLVGAAFAFAIGALFAAMGVAGSFLDMLSGFSFAMLVDPMTGVSSSLLSQLYALIGVMVFIAIGGDAWMIQGLARTYDLVPLTELPSLGTLVGGMESAFASLFVAALELSAPVVIALVITDAALGLVARVVPQLNVFILSFPIKMVVCLVLIGVSLPFVADWLGGELQHSVSDALRILRVS